MRRQFWQWILIAVLALIVGTVVIAWPFAKTSENGTLALVEPSFFKEALAEGEAAGASIVEQEAGIAAYFKADSSINLALARDAFRTIETEGTDYLIGSVAIPNHDEGEDVHVYLHKDGWFLAYYLKDDPAAKIVDFDNMTGATILTTFEAAMAIATDAVGTLPKPLTYYDFRYPNANRMMLVYEDEGNGTSFRIKLPNSFTYYERSAACFGQGTVQLNSNSVIGCGRDDVDYAIITSLAMPTDVFHIFNLALGCCAGGVRFMAIALTYREG